MITLTRIRTLDVEAPTAPGRHAYLSAASGLVRHGDFLYVVSDDEHHLGIFRGEGTAPGQLYRLFEGDLPDDHKARKKQKPDFESLTRLPPFADFAYGALLASGSGSKPNRCNGALLSLDARGAVHGPPRIVDLTCFMAPLATTFGKLNIEGMIVSGDELQVLQRGNKGQKRNAVARFSLEAFQSALLTEGPSPLAPLGVRDYALGEANGVPLTFTDAAALPGGETIFSCVAEDTDDAYEDGACGAAAIGLIGADGGLRWIQRTTEAHKIEGIDARLEGGRLRLLLVTDADNIVIPAGLFAAELEIGL